MVTWVGEQDVVPPLSIYIQKGTYQPVNHNFLKT